MKKLGIEERFIFVDKKSRDDDSRIQYRAMKQVIGKGDLLFMDRLHGLGRSYQEIIQEWVEITKVKGAEIVALDNVAIFDSRKFNSTGHAGKSLEEQFIGLLTYVAEHERNRTRSIQEEGFS